MMALLLAAKSIGEEIAAVLAMLIFGLIASGAQWLKNRSNKPMIDVRRKEDELPKPKTVARTSDEDTFETWWEMPSVPPTVAAGRGSIEMLRRESAEMDRRRRKQQQKSERRSRGEQAQRLAAAIQQNVVLKSEQAIAKPVGPVPRAASPSLSVIGAVDVASLRRAIVLNEVLGPPVALRDTPSSI